MNVSEHANRFIQEAERRGMSQETIKQYSSCIKSFFAQSTKDHPKNINEQDIRDYLSKFDRPNTQRAIHSAVKKFYEIIYHQKNKFRYLPYAKKKTVRPIILSEQECEDLLMATTNLKHFAITIILYSTGVRISELLSIRLLDIDRANMVIHIMHGKGNKQRQVTMKPKLLEIISVYYRKYKPKTYLFENDQTREQYSERSVNEFLKANGRKAGIKKKIHAHLLRHCFCTHSLEHGENLYTVSHIAGHSDPKITATVYAHGSSKIVANAYSPVDNLPINPQRLLCKPN